MHSTSLHYAGVEFYLNGQQIPTDGSGTVDLTNIGNSDTASLECRSELASETLGNGDWFLEPERTSGTNTDPSNRVGEEDDGRGWEVSREVVDGRRVVRLKRVSDTALEGTFTCDISNDSNSPRSLRILHPGQTTARVEISWHFSCCIVIGMWAIFIRGMCCLPLFA